MPLRTVVVDGGVDEELPARLAFATGLARAHDAKLMLVSRLQGHSAAFMHARYAPAAAINQHIEAERQRAADAGARAAEQAARAGVRLDWRGLEGAPEEVLATAGTVADIIVVSQDEADSPAPLAAAVVLTAGRPVLCLPRNGAFPACGRRILVAWNGSRESVRALHDVSPFLPAAQQVIVFTANGAPGSYATPGDAAAWLAAYGAATELRHAEVDDQGVSNAILKAVSDSGADLLVMGAYGRGRLREWVFGGTTRSMLRAMTVPTLLSN